MFELLFIGCLFMIAAPIMRLFSGSELNVDECRAVEAKRLRKLGNECDLKAELADVKARLINELDNLGEVHGPGSCKRYGPIPYSPSMFVRMPLLYKLNSEYFDLLKAAALKTTTSSETAHNMALRVISKFYAYEAYETLNAGRERGLAKKAARSAHEKAQAEESRKQFLAFEESLK